MALINSMGALGSFVGVYVVGLLNGVTGSDGPGFVFMAACLLVAVVCTVLVKVPRATIQAAMETPETVTEMNRAS